MKKLVMFVLILLVAGFAAGYSNTLFLGWNLVAAPYDSDVSIKQGLSSLEGCYQYIFGFYNQTWKSYNPIKESNSMNKISPDYGYWVMINCSNAIWQIVVLPENCTNSFDDDLDGFVDCVDSNCSGHPACPKANGESCAQDSECASGYCRDNVCCDSNCGGFCTACDSAGNKGICSYVLYGQDPDKECGALSCNNYYWGWSGSSCYDRADLTDTLVGCDGSGSCQTAANLCPSQGQGDIVITCHPTCQKPTLGTCTGTTTGMCTNINPGTHSCGIGECYREVPQCVGGVPNPCTPGTPETEVCDGKDNDCDTQTDEGNPGGGGSCNTGLLGVCVAGTIHCQAGALKCIQDTFPSSEVCDGLDNDCDGSVDEGDPGGGGSCNTGLLGVCAAGTVHCQAGALKCTQNTFPSSEVCDGKDNDCDGSVDEGDLCNLPHATSSCVSGVCQVSSCDYGYANCDGVHSNGCEINLNDGGGTCSGASYIG